MNVKTARPPAPATHRTTSSANGKLSAVAGILDCGVVTWAGAAVVAGPDDGAGAVSGAGVGVAGGFFSSSDPVSGFGASFA